MRPRGLRARLTWWYGGSLFIVLLVFAALTVWVQWRVLREALDHHLEEDLEVAAQMLRIDATGAAWRSTEPRDPGYDDGDVRWVEVWDEDGMPLFVRGTDRHRRLQAALGPPSFTRPGVATVEPPGGPPLRILVLAKTIDGRQVFLRVGRTETAIREQLWAGLLALLVAVPVAIAVVTAGGYLMAGRALLPLARMTAHARLISADRLSERLPAGDPHDELGELAGVFNATFIRLEDAFERLRRFTADASHELRTPLTALRSVGEVALRDARTAEAYRDVIGSMLEEAERLTRLVDSLLTLSRWDSGRVVPSRECVDLADLAHDVVGHLEVLGEEKRLAIDVEAGGPAMIVADRLMVRQAVINIVDNAIKFSPAGGRVVVAVTVDDATCTLSVADQGPGIPREHHDRVFDRFYRVDKARARELGGAGLGLAIAHWAVSANEGRVSLTSEDGRGTCFTLTFPAAGRLDPVGSAGA